MDAPVVGYRCWRRSEQGALVATIQVTRWDPLGVNVAQCLARHPRPFYPIPSVGVQAAEERDPHTAPGRKCQCGWYAYDSLRTAEYHAATTVQMMRPQLLLGAVLLWGRLLVGQVRDRDERLVSPGLRYRAEFASILALRHEDRGADEVGRQHSIPVVHGAYLESFARERGEQLRELAS